MITAAALAMAIAAIQPTMSIGLRIHYAELILQATEGTGVAPVLVAAQIEHESHWIASVVGGFNGQCVGLLQMCLHTYGVCNGPLSFSAPACLAKRGALQNPALNIRAGVQHLEMWRVFCLQHTGHADPEHVVSGYMGFGSPRRGIWCGQRQREGTWETVKSPSPVADVLGIYRTLRAALPPEP